ncbi:MAG: portal protein, partial [Gaiellaceae bacterium]
YDAGEKPRRDAKYASIYVAMGVDQKEAGLSEGYLDVFPYSVRRWELIPGSPYAWSPAASVALADGRVLNIAEAALLKGIENKVAPPRVAPDDGIVGELRLDSDSVTYIDYEYLKDGKNPIQTLESGEPKYAVEYIDRKNEEAAVAFFMDLLVIPDREMTLGEFQQRFKIALRDAAPVFEPIEAEYSSMMEGVFDLMIKAKGPADPWGVFKPAPEGIQGSEFRYEFQTALTEAFNDLRRMEGKDALEQYMLLKEAQDPAADNINADAIIRDGQANYPPKWTRPEKDVKVMRDERAQASQEAEQQEQLGQIAQTAANAKPENLRMLQQEVEGAGA